jgi:hypothetical protein
MFNINTWPDDMYPIIFERFQDRLDKRSNIIKQTIGYVKMKANSSNQYAEEGMGGYGYVPDYDGTTITELTQKRGFKTVYTPKEKAAKISVAQKMAQTDESGEAARVGNKLADSLAMTQLRDFYNLFANGWNAGIVGADGYPLFSASHPINGNGSADGTFSNTGTSAFSISAITAAQTTAQRFKTFDGLDFDCDLNFCLIAPELEPKAKEFFGADAKLIPESAENGANPVGGMQYVVVKGFSAKQWAVADKLLLKDYIKMIELTSPIVYPPIKVQQLIQEYVGYMDYVYGWSDSRAIIGQNPA